jgi:hypothetical protein
LVKKDKKKFFSQGTTIHTPIESPDYADNKNDVIKIFEVISCSINSKNHIAI